MVSFDETHCEFDITQSIPFEGEIDDEEDLLWTNPAYESSQETPREYYYEETLQSSAAQKSVGQFHPIGLCISKNTHCFSYLDE